MNLSRLAVCSILLFGLAIPAQAEPTRIVVGVSSADDLLRDLEFLTANLAENETAWKNIIKDNIEIFLIGVGTTTPVRFDSLFDENAEYRTEVIVPVSDLKSFINDNLDPIGINSKRDRSDKYLYELFGGVFTGWLRYLPGDDPYGIISKVKDDVPKDMAHPSTQHADLVKEGYLFFAHLKNESGQEEGRAKAFDKFSKNILDGIQKRPDETAQAYELRSKWSGQQLEQLRQWFVECGEVKIGLKLDREAKSSKADLLFSALPETELHGSIEKISTTASYFAAIPKDEKSIASLRVNWPIDSAMQAKFEEIYKLSQPVAEQAIRKDDKAADDVKEARVEFSKLLLQVMTESANLGAIDMFAELTPSGEHHRLMIGVRCSGQESLTKALAVLPNMEKDWEFKQDIGEVEGVKLHELSVKKSLTPSVAKFYGDSGAVILGVGPDAFWLASGEGAREQLEAAIKQVKTTTDVKPDETLINLHVQALPLVQLMDDMSKEEGAFNLLDELRSRGLMAPKPTTVDKTKDNKKQGDQKEKRQERAQQLASLNWRPTALESLSKKDGTFDLQLKRSDAGVLSGEAVSSEGILRTFGALICQFAEEYLK